MSGIRPARSSCLSEEISGGEAEGGRRGITGLTGGTGRAAEWEMEAGEDKSAPFPLLERSKVTEDMREMMKPNSQEETQRHSGTARMNTDPVVKSLSHLRAQPGPPTLAFPTLPRTRLSLHVLVTSHAATFEVAWQTDSVKNHCQRSHSGTRSVENGTGTPRLGGLLI